MHQSEFQELLIYELRGIKEALMGANDDALTALQAGQAQLATDFATLSGSVATLIAAVGSGGSGAPVNSDISAGVTAVVTDLSTLDASVTALDAQVAAAVAPPAPAPAPAAPVSDPNVS